VFTRLEALQILLLVYDIDVMPWPLHRAGDPRRRVRSEGDSSGATGSKEPSAGSVEIWAASRDISSGDLQRLALVRVPAMAKLLVMVAGRLLLVVYPAQAPAANQSNCWNWFKATDQKRDWGEP